MEELERKEHAGPCFPFHAARVRSETGGDQERMTLVKYAQKKGRMDAFQKNKAIVITGCSSGIGRAMAEYLSRRGFLTFAFVRSTEAKDALETLDEPDLVPIAPIDLTCPDQIRGAVEMVKSELRSRNVDGVYAVIQNAGGGVTAPLELLDLDLLQTELNVRVVGAARLVQELLPEIRSATGRLLWITTPGLIPLAFKGSVHIPEFATQGLARTFRIELARWNIPSILIACGGIRSNAVGRMDRQLVSSLQTWPKDRLSYYEKGIIPLTNPSGPFGWFYDIGLAVNLYDVWKLRRR